MTLPAPLSRRGGALAGLVVVLLVAAGACLGSEERPRSGAPAFGVAAGSGCDGTSGPSRRCGRTWRRTEASRAFDAAFLDYAAESDPAMAEAVYGAILGSRSQDRPAYRSRGG